MQKPYSSIETREPDQVAAVKAEKTTLRSLLRLPKSKVDAFCNSKEKCQIRTVSRVQHV